MNIEFIDIQNFRKLKKCRIDISKNETVFVGANNSGKTTAMDAMIKFLKKNKFSTRDFTLSNWLEINKIGELWLEETEFSKQNLKIEIWEEHLPSIDIWLNVKKNEIHYVNNLIPTLDWDGGFLGVRLRLEPNNIEELFKEFKSTFENSKTIVGTKKNLNLWPNHLWHFLDHKGNLNKFFSIKTHLLNPLLIDTPQKLSEYNIPIDSDVFKSLIKVDIINAQRGFSNENSETNGDYSIKNLSNQLKRYYENHLNPSDNPTEHDIYALSAIINAKKIFDDDINKSFNPSLTELEDLNYPGFSNPKIKLESKLDTVDSLNHNSSVRYELSELSNELSLPEKYNGLGYQNLISMIFKLIAFRDEWMKVGKKYKSDTKEDIENEFEPIHLVLIEEPEAHLHAQVQQVFIKKAYEVLRNHSELKGKNNFTTQLVISTHSNHVAHEIDFTSLRYFKRINEEEKKQIKTSIVENLSETFGKNDDTTKFAIRYLKTTHCDLFFADAVILVEGPVERMLIPHFIKKHYEKLNSCYISILEIGGSHAQTLRPLIEQLGIVTLIITDLDSVLEKKVQPEKKKNYKTGNDVLKSWIPEVTDLDKLLDLPLKSKENKDFPIQVAYQIPIKVTDKIEVYPYTFEDSLVMENKEAFKKIKDSKGLLKKMVDAASETDINKSAKQMFDTITADGAKKAEFALELLYFQDPNNIAVPNYIKEGLNWLENKLVIKKDGLNLI
ncbi:MAG: ATP-dependent nuclease [Flavobacterium sp.]|jgi:predicted ATP-dependent endonuclease of OLD family|uniref:ATP-dependent nuclease n=1 Tax=Flavobacterium sp. TaxID=239 RepID=UPI003BA6FC7F